MHFNNYKSQPALMLNIAKTIAENLKTYNSSFALAKTIYNSAYQKNLSSKIDEVAEKYLGKGKLAEFRKTTLALRDKFEDSNKYVRILKVLIDNEFDEEKTNIFENLDINKDNLKILFNKNKTEVVALLKKIESGLTTELVSKLKEKSINTAVIDKSCRKRP